MDGDGTHHLLLKFKKPKHIFHDYFSRVVSNHIGNSNTPGFSSLPVPRASAKPAAATCISSFVIRQ